MSTGLVVASQSRFASRSGFSLVWLSASEMAWIRRERARVLAHWRLLTGEQWPLLRLETRQLRRSRGDLCVTLRALPRGQSAWFARSLRLPCREGRGRRRIPLLSR